MFPLYEQMFVPSLIVTPLVLLVAYVWRGKSETYPRFWWSAVVICFLLTIFYNILVLSTPFYSQQDHSPDNPGGFSGGASLPAVLAVLFFAFCVVFPSFPTLFSLAFLPPRNLRTGGRSALTALIALYVVVASALIYNKHVRYMADYQQTRKMQLLRKEQEWRLQAPPKRPPPPPQPFPQQQRQPQQERQEPRQRPVA
jgi:hypothetical protein